MYDSAHTDADSATKADVLGRATQRLTHQVSERGITAETFSLLHLYERLYDKADGPEVVLVEQAGVLAVVPP